MDIDTTQIQELINGLCTWARTTGDFVETQAPLLCQDIVRYGQIRAIVQLALALGFSAALVGLACYMMRASRRHMVTSLREAHAKNIPKRCWSELREERREFIILSTVIDGMSLVPLVFAAAPLCTLLRATFAPRLYVLQELGSLLRNIT